MFWEALKFSVGNALALIFTALFIGVVGIFAIPGIIIPGLIHFMIKGKNNV